MPSGDWERSGTKSTVEMAMGLPIGFLVREGLFQPGRRSLAVQWTWASGFKCGVRVAALGDLVVVGFTLGDSDEPQFQRLSVERTVPSKGGFRRWWKCPECGKRCSTVYADKVDGRFSCRGCAGLAYASSQRNHRARPWAFQDP